LAVLQISTATAGDTRLKSPARKPASEWLVVSCSIRSSTPNSMPYGCGLISLGCGGSSWIVRGNSRVSPSGVRYTSLTCGLAMAVCSRYSSTDARPRWYRPSISSVTWVPRWLSQSIFLLSKMRGSFFLVSIDTSK